MINNVTDNTNTTDVISFINNNKLYCTNVFGIDDDETIKGILLEDLLKLLNLKNIDKQKFTISIKSIGNAQVDMSKL